MNLKRISLTVSLLSCFVFAKAQFVNDYLVAADKYFAKGDYYSATQYYEKHLGYEKSKHRPKAGFQPYAVAASQNKTQVSTGSNKQQVVYNLAESYRMLHFHEKAAPYYMEAVSFDQAVFPLAKFHYAQTLRSLERYDEAADLFAAFLQEYQPKDNYAVTAAREIENIQFIQQQMGRKDLKLYSIIKSAELNAEGGTYAPVWLNDQHLLFTSTRPQGTEKNKTTTNRIYQTDYSTGSAGAISMSAVPQAADMQQGVVAVSPDGNTIYLTRWSISKNKKTAAIYSSNKATGNWSEPVLVPALNADGSNNQQPFVMPDGKHIVFASDRNGGAGGFDLWMAHIDANGNISSPENMGENINTAFDEQAPSYHAASNTFVFSSNGRVGMGGFDFYYSKGTLDNLSEPKNFGYPVNSEKDDLYFTSKGSAKNVLENVWLSSDRDAACCLELFSLNKTKVLKQISGVVLTCDNKQPMAGVTVKIVDTVNNKIIAEKITDASGSYSFTMEEFMPLKATGSFDGYFNNSIRFSGPGDEEEDMFKAQDLCLALIPANPISLDNVYYDFNESSLQPESFAALDKLVAVLNDNPTMEIELVAHTDSKGTDGYNQALSEARAKSVVDYLLSKGIARERLQSKGLGESKPIAANTNADGTDNPEGRQLNRRTEFNLLKK